jgi:hypothetical protein
MATPIPGLATQVLASGYTLQVTTGTLQTVVTDHYYYFVSNRTTTGNGQSLLNAIKTLLDASLAGTTWTVVLIKVSGTYRVQLSHNNGANRDLTLSATFAANLGFSSAAFTVAAGGAAIASYPSVWWWTPDMPVSLTGPKLFDPQISYGVPESAGASQRAPDMTVAYVRNGQQWSAEYTFNAVQYLYKIRAQAGFTNQDLETWWSYGPQLGRTFLMWRDRDNATGSNAPTAGISTPYNYVEYAPQETLRGQLPADATAPPNTVYWDVKLDCWVTPNGEGPLSV